MIGSLRGCLAELEPGEQSAECVVEVQGVGYRVTLTSTLATSIGPIGSEVALSVHTYVREGAITLYGFADSGERRCFELLIATHGIGPGLAVAVLGVHTPDALVAAVAEADLDALCRVPGVGKKTAQRLLVELAQRLDTLVPVPAPRVGPSGEAGARSEVAEALAILGYGQDEVRSALERLSEWDEDAPGVEAMLREALRELAPRR
ncbi:MAG: Holliday junction helicase subunit RuvA [Acidimicrobiaceae bacterium]|nr:Holliday junction helicase subunit RuvA [Acidimicrobiaceae bacterium]